MHCNGIPLPGSVPGANATREPSVVLAVDTKEAPTADAPTQCTTPRTTASRVASFLAERDAARDLVYDAVLARAGYIIVAGIIPTLLAMALDPFNLLDNAMFYYVFSVGYITAGCGVTLMTTLPLADFDCTWQHAHTVLDPQCLVLTRSLTGCSRHTRSCSARPSPYSHSQSTIPWTIDHLHGERLPSGSCYWRVSKRLVSHMQ